MVALGTASANLTLTCRGDRAGCASHGCGRQARYSLATNSCYALYRSRFLCRFAFMRLRRLCFAIFAFRLFLREPIRFSNSRVPIQPSDALQCNPVLTLLGNITSLIFHLASTETHFQVSTLEVCLRSRPDSQLRTEVEYPALRRSGPSLN